MKFSRVYSTTDISRLNTIFCREYRSIFNHCDVIGLQSYRGTRQGVNLCEFHPLCTHQNWYMNSCGKYQQVAQLLQRPHYRVGQFWPKVKYDILQRV